MNLWKGYLRWRHSKGYGVHSPYAYRFIIDVLNPGIYGYYAYNQIENLSRGQSFERRSFFNDVRFLIRLIIFLKSKRLITYKWKSPEAQIVCKALKIIYYGYNPSSDISFKQGDLVLLPPNEDVEKSFIKKVVESGIPVFARYPSPRTRKLLEEPLDRGLLFTGKTKILLIPRKEMHYISYDIKW